MKNNNLTDCKELIKKLIEEADCRQAVLTLTFLTAMLGKEEVK